MAENPLLEYLRKKSKGPNALQKTLANPLLQGGLAGMMFGSGQFNDGSQRAAADANAQKAALDLGRSQELTQQDALMRVYLIQEEQKRQEKARKAHEKREQARRKAIEGSNAQLKASAARAAAGQAELAKLDAEHAKVVKTPGDKPPREEIDARYESRKAAVRQQYGIPQDAQGEEVSTKATGNAAVAEGADPLVKLIVGAESNGNYDRVLGDGKYTPAAFKGLPLTGMTFGTVKDLQAGLLYAHREAIEKEMLAKGKSASEAKRIAKKQGSSAVGVFQIVGSTLRGLQKKLGFKDSDKFDAAAQNALGAEQLLNKRGLPEFLSGEISQDEFIDRLSKEWQVLPNRDGKISIGSTKGQPAKVQLDQLRGAIGALTNPQEQAPNPVAQALGQAPQQPQQQPQAQNPVAQALQAAQPQQPQPQTFQPRQLNLPDPVMAAMSDPQALLAQGIFQTASDPRGGATTQQNVLDMFARQGGKMDQLAFDQAKYQQDRIDKLAAAKKLQEGKVDLKNMDIDARIDLFHKEEQGRNDRKLQEIDKQVSEGKKGRANQMFKTQVATLSSQRPTVLKYNDDLVQQREGLRRLSHAKNLYVGLPGDVQNFAGNILGKLQSTPDFFQKSAEELSKFFGVKLTPDVIADLRIINDTFSIEGFKAVRPAVGGAPSAQETFALHDITAAKAGDAKRVFMNKFNNLTKIYTGGIKIREDEINRYNKMGTGIEERYESFTPGVFQFEPIELHQATTKKTGRAKLDGAPDLDVFQGDGVTVAVPESAH